MVFLGCFLAVDVIIPTLATRDRSLSELIIIILPAAGLLGATGFGWFSSMMWPSFYALVPPMHAGQYAGIFLLFQSMTGWMEQVCSQGV
jgi:hypothetical protein